MAEKDPRDPPSARRLSGTRTPKALVPVDGEVAEYPSREWLFSAVVENIPKMIFVKDAKDLAFAVFNRAGEELLGRPRSDLLGKTDFDLFSFEDAERFQAKDRETLERGVLVDIPEEKLQTPNGTRWLHTVKVPIVDGEGTPRYLLGMSEDITERHEQDLAMRRAQMEAEAASAELESFAYSVAHDLRSPLRGIDGFSQALLEDYGDQLDAIGQHYLRNVRQAAQQMAHRIDDLLTLSHLARGPLARERVDLGLIARQELDRRLNATPERDVEIVIADDLVADADPRLVTIVLDNLIDNALKFTRRREAARIEVGRSGANDRTFFVRDDGVGFDMTYAAKLFGIFQRLHAMNEFEGTGIGLATVQRIIRRHGGRVWAEGRVGEGATISFTLDHPLAEPECDENG